MSWDSWYDLAIRELCDLSDPVKEKLAEAERELAEGEPDADDDETPSPLAGR